MKAKIVQIGNSKGIRLPKLVLEQVGLEEDVELEVREGELVISPASRPRSGWGEAAEDLSREGDDQLLDKPVPTEFDEQEWTW